SSQTSLQTVSPGRQEHAPLTHCCPIAHLIPQAPQLLVSTSRLTQREPHILPAQGGGGTSAETLWPSVLTSSMRAPRSWCSASTMWSTMQSTSSDMHRSPEQPTTATPERTRSDPSDKERFMTRLGVKR